MPRSIPERWLAYEPYGAVIDGTNILAIKVPLKETISRHLPPTKQFTPAKLMAQFPKMKFLVDLTNTNRYYHSKEFENAGIKYIKIMVPGQQVPPLECVKRFCTVMNEFKSTAKTGELIGVHCTHGVNRTGYLICRYLVQQLGWEPQKSLKAFEKARGYPIERAAYVTDLMNVPRTKLDVSSVNLRISGNRFDHRARNMNGRPYPLPPRPPFNGLLPPRAFGGPRPPIMPPLPPPPSGRWLEGPRPQAYGMLPPRPPGPGPFPGPRFAPRMPGPPGMPSPSRLPPPNIGPPSRLPGPGMPPPRLPPPGMILPRIPPPGISPRLPPPGISPRLPPPGMGPPRLPLSMMAPPRTPPPRLSNVRRALDHLRCEMPGSGPFIRSKTAKLSHASLGASDGNPTVRTTKDLDFTVDTFDENLTASVGP